MYQLTRVLRRNWIIGKAGWLIVSSQVIAAVSKCIIQPNFRISSLNPTQMIKMGEWVGWLDGWVGKCSKKVNKGSHPKLCKKRRIRKYWPEQVLVCVSQISWSLKKVHQKSRQLHKTKQLFSRWLNVLPVRRIKTLKWSNKEYENLLCFANLSIWSKYFFLNKNKI